MAPDSQDGTGLVASRGQAGRGQAEGQGRAVAHAPGRVLDVVLLRAVQCCILVGWTSNSQAVDISSVN